MDPLLELSLNVLVFAMLVVLAYFIFPESDEGRVALGGQGAPKAGAVRGRPNSIKGGFTQEKLRHISPTRETNTVEERAGCQEDVQRLRGVVQRYSERNGIGYIACSECRDSHGRDVNLLATDWQAAGLHVGSAVSFRMTTAARQSVAKGRPWAFDVTKLEGDEADEVQSIEAEAMKDASGGSEPKSSAPQETTGGSLPRQRFQ
ncbi:unnamed protein product [Polarella glacialis]|uniref:Uncharacterized protein n=1 Tax=Polarella glacialis TaxID=89957 RepID=A0A813KP66_POLGL|nr:unnamed protein product [Polarella glacialis]